MKLYKTLAACLTALLAAAAFTGCDEELDLPPVNPPQLSDPSLKANMSILDLKTLTWSTDRNYADTVGLTPEGERVIIAGRVISSDSTGNIYKSLIIQDATAALAISLDTTKLYLTYPVGEMVYIDMTGMNVGKYNGLYQMGQPEPYQSTYEISFMPFWQFTTVAQRDGLPNVELVDTIHTTISQIKSWKASEDSIIRYQSQLICLDDVEFVGGGSLTWADNGSTVNRQLRDRQGNTLTVRNSGYASFGRDMMPSGFGQVVCILSYYGTDWQLMMRTTLDCHGFGGEGSGSDTPSNPGESTQPDGDGTAEKPYSIAQVIGGATGSDKWVTGYIVGWVDGASISEGARFDASNVTSQSNILIAASADVTSTDQCVPVQLPTGTDVRSGLNLQSHPDNLGKQVSLCGSLEKYFLVPGLKSVKLYNWGNTGADSNPEIPETPAGEVVTFKAVTSITSGSEYVMVADGKLALPLSGTYGYLQVADVTVTDGTVSTDAANAFTFKAAEGGYTITDASGKYLYMKDSYNSFNLESTAVEGSVWTVTFTGDAVRITNVLKDKTIQYDGNYTSYGAYSDDRATLPVLYERVK